jgi:paraquat-inducible protein B
MNSSTPKVSRAPRLPLIWVVPLLAVVVGAWMLLRDLRHRGPEITIEFSDATGLEAGTTVLQYKGVSSGLVDSVALKPDLSGTLVKVRVDKGAGDLARTGALFWIVRPEIGLGGVSGLDTLLSGVHLTVRPGSGPPATQFKGLEKAPPPEIPNRGKTFVLQSDRLGSLTTGAPIFYREFKVGEVETSRLADDSTSVLVRIHLEEPYVDLVRTNTRFWNTGGFNFKVNLMGAQLKDTSLESLLSGGVAFASPDGDAFAPAAPDGTRFTLVADPEKEWLKWNPSIPIKSPESVSKSPPKTQALSELMKP